MHNPIDDILEEMEEKTANPGGPSFWNQVKEPAVGAAGMAIAGAAVGGAAMAAQHLYDAATKSSDFRQMLMHNEDLAQHDNPKAVNMAFTTLRRFSPQFSKDPLVAGSYVRRLVESPMGAAAIINESLTGSSRLTDRIGDMAQQGAISGLRYKDPKEQVAKDQTHQRSMEDYKHGLQKSLAQYRHGLGQKPAPGESE